MASTQATKEAIWMIKLMKELGYMKEKKVIDALPSPRVNPLEGSPKCSCGKRDSEGAPDLQL
jgi:hypothetical protein